MRIQNEIVLSFAIALTITSTASAQRRSAPAMPAEAGVAITLQVAGQPYRFEGTATCQHAPVASIYNVLAERWSVQQSDGQRSIALALWRCCHRRQVVRRQYGEAQRRQFCRGFRKGALAPSGAGGTFTINATAVNGAAITGTIKCSTFSDAIAVGG